MFGLELEQDELSLIQSSLRDNKISLDLMIEKKQVPESLYELIRDTSKRCVELNNKLLEIYDADKMYLGEFK